MELTKSPSREAGGEILVAWQKYTATCDDELSLRAGDVVELIDTNDPQATKKLKLDPDLEVGVTDILSTSSARHKLSVKPRRKHTSSRYSPTRLNVNARWLVREVSGSRREGWVPCQVLQTIDDPTPGTGLPGDAAFRRQAVVKELVETEQEFVRDLDYVVQNYLFRSESKKVPKVVRDNFEVIFGNLKEIAEFHRTVLMEGVKYYENEPHMLGKAYLRLERDFDKHVNYCKDEPQAQIFLETCTEAKEYFEVLSRRLGDDKSLSEHLKLPIQRINDYQLLLKELVRYSACLGEDNTNLQKALELMLSIPSRAEDNKFISSIEGYRGSVHKLGRLIAHDWFSITVGDIVKERYLFLFKSRILICKVRRVSDDRSVFQLKDVVKLQQIELKDHEEEENKFEFIDKSSKSSVLFTTHREGVKENWLSEIREFIKKHETEENRDISPDEFRVASPPTEGTTDQAEKTATPKEETKPIPAEPKVSKQQITKEPTETPVDKPISVVPVKPKVEKKSIEVQKKPHELEPTSKQTNKTFSVKKVDEVKIKTDIKSSVKQSISTKAEAKKEDKTSSAILIDQSGSTEVKSEKTTVGKRTQETHQLIAAETSDSKTSKTKSVSSQKRITESKHQATREQSPSHPQSPYPPPDEFHYKRIEEVEPLIEISKARFIEEVLPYSHPLYKAPHGSALEKLCSVQPVFASDHVVADYSVGVEVNVEIGDEMSRRYTSSSSSRADGLESYTSRRSTQSSFSSDGYSSKYSTGSTSSKYGTPIDSALTGESRYNEISTKYSSRSKSDAGELDSYSKYSRKPSTEGGDDYGFSRRSIRSKTSALDEGENDSSYSRRIKSYGERGGDAESYIYSRKSVITDSTLGVSDGNSYMKKRTITAAEAVSDGESVSLNKATRTFVEGDTDLLLGKSRRGKVAELDDQINDDYKSKYTKRSTSIKDGDEDLISKYSRKYSRTDSQERPSDVEEDVYSKYSRKYSRSTSRQKEDELPDKNERKKDNEVEDIYSKYSRKYSRSDSRKKDEDSSLKKVGEEEEDILAKYSRKYSRSNSRQKDENEEYSRRYSRTESREDKEIEDKHSKQYSRRTSRKNEENNDDPYTRYKNKYLRSESAESSNSYRRQSSGSSEKQDDEIKTESKTMIHESSSAFESATVQNINLEKAEKNPKKT